MARVWDFKNFETMVKQISKLETVCPGAIRNMEQNRDILKIKGKIWRGIIKH